ncbi:MAG: hypothetical protein ED559_06145 [Phycisphaera sp.]|nr:MAG: hypothetical protein ED559_06145 [Phycisphaera sp.]
MIDCYIQQSDINGDNRIGDVRIVSSDFGGLASGSLAQPGDRAGSFASAIAAFAVFLLENKADALRGHAPAEWRDGKNSVPKAMYDGRQTDRPLSGVKDRGISMGIRNGVAYARLDSDIKIRVFRVAGDGRAASEITEPIEIERLAQEIVKLKGFSDNRGPRVTRLTASTKFSLADNVRRYPLNSSVLNHGRPKERSEFLESCDIVMSAPGSVFFAGEKVGVDGAPATLVHVPRRVHVGLTRAERESGILPLKNTVLLPLHEHEPVPETASTYGPIDPIAYRVLEYATEYVTGERPPAIDVLVWSEWDGESGLGWSAAFSASTAGAVLRQMGVMADTSRPVAQWGPDEWDVFAVASAFEAATHGGRAQASSVAAALTHTSLPVRFRTGKDESEQTPWLWSLSKKKDPKPEDPPTRDEFPDRLKEMVRKFVDYIRKDRTWSISTLGGIDPGPQAQAEAWERFQSIGNILVVDTGTTGTTHQASSFELNSPVTAVTARHARDAMASCASAISDEIDAVFSWRSDKDDRGELVTPDKHWQRAIELVTKYRGFLMGHGFAFPLGDAVLGRIRLVGGSKTECKSVGGKTSGKGIAGNLLVVTTAEQSLRDKIHRAVYSSTFAHLGVLYDSSVDGYEPDGLRLERAGGVKR